MYEKIDVPVGVFADYTDYTVGPRWVAADKVRFREGKPQKIGGWTTVSSDLFDGVCRGMQIWSSLANVKYIGLGTHTHLEIMAGELIYDITPVRESGSLTNPFDTTISSVTVTVNDSGHGLAANDRVFFSGASAGGGITIDGEYTVTSIIDTNTYTITHTVAATSTASGTGGTVDYTYYIPVGRVDSELGEGWGVGPWGSGGWGAAYSPGLFLLPARTWSLDNWGEDLVANPRGGGIYVWDTSVGTSSPAVLATNSPNTNYIIVSPTTRHLIALGSDSAGGDIDGMLVEWCSQEDYTVWTAATTNTAGSQRLQEGSQLISGLNTRGLIFLFTDTSVYGMQYLGPPYTFGFDLLGKNCGIMAPHAAVEVASRVFWWSRTGRQFFTFDGAVRQVPCPLIESIHEDINFDQRDKVFAVSVSEHNEVWWFYPSADSDEIDSYLIYNYAEDCWSLGTMARTAGIDRGYYDNVRMTGTDYYIYDHESGNDANGSAIDAYVETGEFEIPQSENMLFIDKFIPDADVTGTLYVTFYTRKYPNDTQITKGPYTITSSTTKNSVRVKGRQFALKFESTAIGDHWRLGTSRVNIMPDGER